uniref:Uncharacterized protein n=1 Tax=Cacopsylla melanoneura TaxID=428564 RepID=A0A8D8WAA5_9HEMI
MPMRDGIYSLGSYFSFMFSSRFESSSNILRLARTDLTMSDGCSSWTFISSSLCRTGFSILLVPVTFLLPDHFSYFSSNDLSLSSQSVSCVHEEEGSESSDEEEGGRGGGTYGGEGVEGGGEGGGLESDDKGLENKGNGVVGSCLLLMA